MRVRMMVPLSGTRNGKDWPKVGGVIDLPDDEARGLVSGHVAIVARDLETADAPVDMVETATSPRRKAKAT